MRPFPIYPLYTQTVILSLDKPIADCFLFRPRKSRKSAGNAVIPTFPTHWSHGLQHLRHKRRNARFKRLRRVHTRLRQQDRTQRITGRNRGVSDGGWYHYPRSVLRGSETLRGRVSERQTLPLLGLGRVCSRRTQRAFGTAMRLCASLFRGVAAPLGCVIFFASAEIAVCMPCAQGLSVCARRGVVSLWKCQEMCSRETPKI